MLDSLVDLLQLGCVGGGLILVLIGAKRMRPGMFLLGIVLVGCAFGLGHVPIAD